MPIESSNPDSIKSSITKTVCIEPLYLDKDIKKHIYEKLKKELINKCNVDHGFISKIYKNIEIINNSVSTTNASVYFDVKVNIKTIKPKEGNVYTGKVNMVFQSGLFVEIFGDIIVFIPASKMTKYKFINNEFVKGIKNISQNDTIEIVLELIQYENKKFNCIGRLN